MSSLWAQSAAYLQEELNQVQVIGLLPAVVLQQAVDTGFQKQSIIHSIQTYAWLSGEQSNASNLSLSWIHTKTTTPIISTRLHNPLSMTCPHYLLIPADLSPAGVGVVHDVI